MEISSRRLEQESPARARLAIGSGRPALVIGWRNAAQRDAKLLNIRGTDIAA
jgi:hypothetical protein